MESHAGRSRSRCDSSGYNLSDHEVTRCQDWFRWDDHRALYLKEKAKTVIRLGLLIYGRGGRT